MAVAVMALSVFSHIAMEVLALFSGSLLLTGAVGVLVSRGAHSAFTVGFVPRSTRRSFRRSRSLHTVSIARPVANLLRGAWQDHLFGVVRTWLSFEARWRLHFSTYLAFLCCKVAHGVSEFIRRPLSAQLASP